MLFMKMAQAREARKENKGFSLVELIIVIAIMVALVAMLAPQFVKYVAKSRNAVVTTAAEDVLATAKSDFALTKMAFSGTSSGTITIGADSSNHLSVTMSGLKYKAEDTDASYMTGTEAEDAFETMCGIDTGKTTASTYVYTITITNNNGSPTFSMALTNS